MHLADAIADAVTAPAHRVVVLTATAIVALIGWQPLAGTPLHPQPGADPSR